MVENFTQYHIMCVTAVHQQLFLLTTASESVQSDSHTANLSPLPRKFTTAPFTLRQFGHLTDQPQNSMLNLMCIPASMFSNEKEEDLQPVRVQLLISLLPVKPEKLFETGELGVQHDQVFTYPSPPSTFHRRHSVGPPSLERSLPERVRL